MDVVLLFSIPMVIVALAIVSGDRGRRHGRRGDAAGRDRRRRVEGASSGGFPNMNNMS